ncbi:hypothetical protein U9M48_027553 [Paspalum notatum var. saurae]|uniref:Reverse transcriptase Ty1/copia-type domain-containing protein n=1 Tax=Paspalum notatum var. saurae TaxID=547442 RepID=A0AAQ3WZJ4_PASNO
MFTTNVPKFLWGEAVKTATYLINRMNLRVLDNKSPAELLLKSNEFVLSPKVFGCVCFVHDYKNNVGKLDAHAVKCVFVGYSPTQDSASIPTNWKLAKEDPKWKEAMLEEMRALEKNKTWELVDLPPGKQPVGCKWVFTIKHTPEGKVERYKARLVAKGYTQTHGIDYDETFAPVAKMNSVRTLISCDVNLDWNIY